MEERSTKFTLLLTGIFLLCLLVLAAILKPERTKESSLPSTTSTTPVSQAKPAIAAEGPAQPSDDLHGMLPPPSQFDASKQVPAGSEGEHPHNFMVLPKISNRQEVFPRCRLKPDVSNDGDSFSVLTGAAEHRFCLYFVNAPDTIGGSMKETQDQSKYFDKLTEQQLASVAQVAKKRVIDILTRKPTFDVITRWEPAPEESPKGETTYRAFVIVETDDGELENLATILVNEGLASICKSKEPLPDGTTPADYIKKLWNVQTQARSKGLGAWKLGDRHDANAMQVKYETR